MGSESSCSPGEVRVLMKGGRFYVEYSQPDGQRKCAGPWSNPRMAERVRKRLLRNRLAARRHKDSNMMVQGHTHEMAEVGEQSEKGLAQLRAENQCERLKRQIVGLLFESDLGRDQLFQVHAFVVKTIRLGGTKRGRRGKGAYIDSMKMPGRHGRPMGSGQFSGFELNVSQLWRGCYLSVNQLIFCLAETHGLRRRQAPSGKINRAREALLVVCRENVINDLELASWLTDVILRDKDTPVQIANRLAAKLLGTTPETLHRAKTPTACRGDRKRGFVRVDRLARDTKEAISNKHDPRRKLYSVERLE